VLGCAPFDERHNSANIAEWMTRELKLKPALLTMLGSPEYSSHHRSLQKIKERDWVVMANVVTVLKVIFS